MITSPGPFSNRTSPKRARSSAGLLVAFVLIALLVPVPAAAHLPELLWSRDVGRALNDVAVRGTNTFVAGSIRFRGSDALVVQRYGGAGKLFWTRAWRPRPVSGREPWAEGLAVAAGPDGAVYVGGAASGCGERELASWFLRKYGPGGKLVWSLQPPVERGCGSRAFTYFQDLAVRQGLVVAARMDCEGDYCDGMVDVFSTSGIHLRTIPFEPLGPPTLSADVVGGVAIRRGGIIYAAGSVAMRFSFDPPPDYEIAVSAFRASGVLLWSRILRDRGARDLDAANSVAAGAAGAVIAGTEQREGCRSTSGSFRLCPVAMALDTHGRVRWRWRGGQPVTTDGGAIDAASGTGIVAAWTRQRGDPGRDDRILMVRLRHDGRLLRIDRWTRGSPRGVGVTGDRLSIAGVREGRHGVVWRFAI